MNAMANEVAVAPNLVEGLDVAPGEAIISLEGVVWVTTSSHSGDILLGPGDRIAFAKRGRAVVGGLRGRGVKLRLEPANAN